MNVRQPTLQDAFALHSQGRLGEAARIYEAIAAREPGNAEARQYLGAIYVSAGRIAEAKALMKRALELKPSDFAFLENYVGALVLAEDFDEALELSQKALKRQPPSANMLYLCAVSLQRLHRLAEARERLAALLRLAPGHPSGRKEYAATLGASRRNQRGAAGRRGIDRRAARLRRRLSGPRQHSGYFRPPRSRSRRLRSRAGVAPQRSRRAHRTRSNPEFARPAGSRACRLRQGDRPGRRWRGEGTAGARRRAGGGGKIRSGARRPAPADRRPAAVGRGVARARQSRHFQSR